jgi:hypothetical protein
MKTWLAFFFFFSATSFAQTKLCAVYGISDSPQKLDCKLNGEDLKLRCESGVYFLNEERVSVAYHEEVEDGPVPLIFRTDDSRLSIMMYSPRKIEAQFSRSNRSSLSGNCSL